MGYLDVPSPHAHLKCSQQTHHFHQLGMGLFLEEHSPAIDFASGKEVVNLLDVFILFVIFKYETINIIDNNCNNCLF